MIKSDDEKDELNKEDKRIKNNKITEEKKKINSFVANIEKKDKNKNMKAYLIEKKKFCWKS